MSWVAAVEGRTSKGRTSIGLLWEWPESADHPKCSAFLRRPNASTLVQDRILTHLAFMPGGSFLPGPAMRPFVCDAGLLVWRCRERLLLGFPELTARLAACWREWSISGIRRQAA